MHTTEEALRQALTVALEQVTGKDASGGPVAVMTAEMLEEKIKAALDHDPIPNPRDGGVDIAYLVRQEDNRGEELYSWHHSAEAAEEHLNSMEEADEPDFEPVVVKITRHRHLDVGKKYTIYNS